jgi:hypothetical protein
MKLECRVTRFAEAQCSAVASPPARRREPPGCGRFMIVQQPGFRQHECTHASGRDLGPVGVAFGRQCHRINHVAPIERGQQLFGRIYDDSPNAAFSLEWSQSERDSSSC